MDIFRTRVFSTVSLARLGDTCHFPFDCIYMHEFVAGCRFEGSDMHELDIVKRLMDYDFRPPTNFFPLIVPEALMIEPAEIENQDALDRFADTLIKIAEKAKTKPEYLHSAPNNTKFDRMDEVKAARDLVLYYWFPEDMIGTD